MKCKNRLVVVGDWRPELGPRGFVWERFVCAPRVGHERVAGTARVSARRCFRTVRCSEKEHVHVGRVVVAEGLGAFCVFLNK